MRALLASIAACTTSAVAAQPKQDSARATDPDRAVTVQMKNAKGQSVGTVEVRKLEHGTMFIADLRNLPPGPHGFHVHERGVCEPPTFQSAGEHYNPRNTEHGFDSPRGPHAGDLPNIHVTPRGTARAEVHSTQLTLGPPGGSAVGRRDRPVSAPRQQRLGDRDPCQGR